MPVLGVIFLRHAANRFEAATTQIQEDQATGEDRLVQKTFAEHLEKVLG